MNEPFAEVDGDAVRFRGIRCAMTSAPKVLQNEKLQRAAVGFLRDYTSRDPRFPDAPLEERARHCVIALSFAAMAISEAAAYLERCRLDPARTASVDEYLEHTDELRNDLSSYVQQMPIHARCYDNLAVAIQVSALANPEDDPAGRHLVAANSRRMIAGRGQSDNQPVIDVSEAHGRGRPTNLYLQETESLINLYETTTGRSATQPRMHQGDATDHSTIFIHDCLHKIDPQITPSYAATCIRNILMLRKTRAAEKHAREAEVEKVLQKVAADEKEALKKKLRLGD